MRHPDTRAMFAPSAQTKDSNMTTNTISKPTTASTESKPSSSAATQQNDDSPALGKGAQTDHRHLPAGSEVRGFALYVGLDERKIAAGDPSLGAIVAQIKDLVAQLAPAAESYASVALAPQGAGGRDVDVVRFALGDPSAIGRKREAERADADRAASGITIDLTRKHVLIDSVSAALTYREFELLSFLVLREGRTVSREELIEGLWSGVESDEEAPNERTIDVHIRRLRVKLDPYPEIVRTVRGTGYRFDRHADVTIRVDAGRSPDLV